MDPVLPPGFDFSSDSDRMDRERVHMWLSEQAYWALGRPREIQDTAIEGSRNFGIFDSAGAQVAYAHVVTDGVTFAWLCDVFVDPAVRGAGVGRALIELLCAELDNLGVGRTLLKTAQAHDLYRRSGFEVLPDAEPWMLRTADR